MRISAFLIVTLLAAPAFAVTQWMDAAELDKYGDPLGFAASRIWIDNGDGVSDLTNVRFKLNWTGTATGLGGLTWDDPENPWYGSQNALPVQIVGGKKYMQGDVYYPPTQEWGPAFYVDPTPDNDMDPWNDYELFDAVPAGVAWDRCFDIQGDDVHLFQSPASGETSFNGDTYSLYDSDPMPQTIPEPGVLALLLVGCLAWNLRRRRQIWSPV